MKFMVNGIVTVSCWTEVEADSEQEAIEIASERQLAQLCHNPWSDSASECFHFEADGEPTELRAEAA